MAGVLSGFSAYLLSYESVPSVFYYQRRWWQSQVMFPSLLSYPLTLFLDHGSTAFRSFLSSFCHHNIFLYAQKYHILETKNLDFKSDVDRLGSLAKLLNKTLKTSKRRDMRMRLMGNNAKKNKVKS